MPRKLILETIANQRAPDFDSDSSSESSDRDDEKLQTAFAEGKLKPGFYGQVVFKKDENKQIFDKKGLVAKLDEIKVFQNDWLERLDLLSEPAKPTSDVLEKFGNFESKLNEQNGESNSHVQNDFRREMLFYQQAQASVIEGIKKLRNIYGVKQISRPDDYFAEMMKSDDHMQKVRERLQAKQTAFETSEKAKKFREMKKFGKKVQQEVQLKRQQEKKELLQKIQNYKKGKSGSLDFLDDDQPNNKTKKSNANNNKNKEPKLTKKRQYKESRYGYGGQKKRSKSNSAESAASLSGFSVRKHGRPMNKNKRLGKSKRQKLKKK